MPTAEGIVVLALSGFLLLVAINLQAGWLYAMTALLAAVFSVGVVSARTALRRLSVERHLPAHAVEGDRITLAFVHRGGRWPHGVLEIQDAGSGYAPVQAIVVPASSRMPARVTAPSVALRRGAHRLGPFEVRSRGLTGLFLTRRQISGDGEFVVYPQYWSLATFPLPGPNGTAADALQSRRSGLDVDGVREYRDGDSLRHVHWRSTARRGTLVVREFAQEGDRDVSLLIDARAAIWSNGSAERFEEVIRAAASIARSVTATGGTVRIITDQDGTLLDVAGGWAHVLEVLARIRPTGLLSASDAWMRAAPGGQALVALSGDVRDLMALAGRGMPLVAVVSDGVPTTGAALSALRDLGVPACVLRPGDDIKAALESWR